MFAYEFMHRAFWAGTFLGLSAPVLGVYLMLRRQVLMADTLSHVSLAGVALGTFMKWNPAMTGFAVAIAAGLLVEQLRRTYRTYSEVPVAIMMTSGLAFAVVLMSLGTNLSKSFSSYLFGSIVAVSDTQLRLIGGVALVGLLFFALLRRPLYNLTFDEETAAIGGVRVGPLSFAFSVLTGMTVAAAMPVVGVLLVSALMVLPAALALRIAGGFLSAILIAVAAGLTGIYGGLTASYYINTPPGGTIALILLVFLLTGIGCKRLTLIVRRGSRRHKKEKGSYK
ncbi:metal ABC transporter permease [Saccharibacillus sp. CPCC 101409]|uniref:metal ABC transporter permease n=1 Tax=Saccharibacillus sp. CPCC 101409 TaxID=3058041 RepID=UPI002670EA12|nr:metal ABC transporter permease [Saccharibacillus sp. CPCC 101409]MDO3413330.1 metal ABC transporter permease [Saccharibacillus sp. CPCC 101409]